jgi:tetratricopeptide (TPR) repeat protein
MSSETAPNAPSPSFPFDRTAGLSPSAIRLLAEANAALAQRNAPLLQSRFSALTALAPSHPEVQRLQAAILHAQGRRDESIALLRRVLDARPGDAQTAFDLGNALAQSDDREAAAAAFRRSADTDPRIVAPLLALAQLEENDGDVERALATIDEALARAPDSIAARNRRARALHYLGRIDEADAEFRRTLEQKPEAASAWYGLSTLATRRFGEDDLAAIEHLATLANVRESERAPLLFALAKAREDHGRYDEAFVALSAANAIRRQHVRWDAARFSANVRAIEAAFSEPSNDRKTGTSDASRGDGVVFIVGMPRSGSTLIEEILAAHPDIAAGGELDIVRDIVRDESQRRGADFPAWIDDASAADWQALGDAYVERIAATRGAKRVLTDKALLNWRYLGALRAMLPGARFIDCRRDALETCLSCFRQLFANEQAFTYDVGELASFWRDYDRLMRFWNGEFGDRILTIEHEALTSDGEREIRRLLDFCGLPFDGACLRFQENERGVRTASAAQVREPLRAATTRADRYGAVLDPLRAMLTSR